MPYEMKHEGEKWCIYKKDDGASNGCSSSRAMAVRHLRALYAHEPSDTKEQHDNFDKFIEAMQEYETKSGDIIDLSEMYETSLVNEQSMFERIVAKVKELFAPPPIDTFMVYKDTETGTSRWLARYSNNILDNDYPPEIISERSHRLFVDKVEKGLAPYPELWLWHIKEYTLGKSDWLAYDDSGFALAAGYFYKGRESVADWLGTQKWLISHGMPIPAVKYDPDAPNVVIEHETREISPLPPRSAANKRTGFGVYLNKDKQTMSIPVEKKNQLINMGLSADQLDALEQLNAAEAAAAKEASIATKELLPKPVTVPSGEAVVPDPVVVVPIPPPDPPVRPVPIPPPDPPLPGQSQVTREEIASEVAQAIGSTVNPLLERLMAFETSLGEISKQLKQLTKTDEDKIAEKAVNVPAASLSAMIAQRIIGNKATLVASNDPLLANKPKETTPGTLAKTGVPMLDNLLALQDKK